MKKLLLGALLLVPSAVFAQTPAPCPAACSVTLPGTSWDALGNALNDAVKIRQDLFSELSRQIQAQMPKTPAQQAPEPKAP